jgi:nicotinate-nucleotide adenylyltransferase
VALEDEASSRLDGDDLGLFGSRIELAQDSEKVARAIFAKQNHLSLDAVQKGVRATLGQQIGGGGFLSLSNNGGVGREGADASACEDVAGNFVAAGESLAKKRAYVLLRQGLCWNLDGHGAAEQHKAEALGKRGSHAIDSPVIPTGLLGGSFNPAHRGHRRVSAATIRALGLDEMWWLVSPGNPLKPVEGMAPLPTRLASARRLARGLPIRATAIEQELGTRYTVDTLAALVRLYPDRRFIWLMGEDNLAQFHLWRHWRKIAQRVPIAVVSRPGYDGAAHAARAMGWLRRFVQPADQARHWTEWRTPALVLLRLPLDPTSATGIRAADPNWHLSEAYSFNPRALRDGVTRRLVT